MTHDQDLLGKQLQFAAESLEKVQQEYEAMHRLMLAEVKARVDAEQSRDTVRAHAQDALDKYRAQDRVLAKVRSALLEAYLSTQDKSDILAFITTCLGDLDGVTYSHDNPPPGYASCTRTPGHDGPCALPFK